MGFTTPTSTSLPSSLFLRKILASSLSAIRQESLGLIFHPVKDLFLMGFQPCAEHGFRVPLGLLRLHSQPSKRLSKLEQNNVCKEKGVALCVGLSGLQLTLATA